MTVRFVDVHAPIHEGNKYKVYWFMWGELKKAKYGANEYEPNGIREFKKKEDAIAFGKQQAIPEKYSFSKYHYDMEGTRYRVYDEKGRCIENKVVTRSHPGFKLVDVE